MNERFRKEERSMRTKRRIIVAVVLVIAVGAVLLLVNTASFKRTLKGLQSDVTGGLERNIKVYDYTGNVIREYNGKYDIQENDGTKVMFDDSKTGKRTIIYNAPVIVEEE